ncbi:MAG: hypothetical protein E6I48_07810 [Chloroflexi bacterium]|nr:MAG: hypothetical protein E6I48_07810 [Chloroflexota bacterium]
MDDEKKEELVDLLELDVVKRLREHLMAVVNDDPVDGRRGAFLVRVIGDLKYAVRPPLELTFLRWAAMLAFVALEEGPQINGADPAMAPGDLALRDRLLVYLPLLWTDAE